MCGPDVPASFGAGYIFCIVFYDPECRCYDDVSARRDLQQPYDICMYYHSIYIYIHAKNQDGIYIYTCMHMYCISAYMQEMDIQVYQVDTDYDTIYTYI